MIPWQHFQPGYRSPANGQHLGVDLHEEYLHFVDSGPSMAEMVFMCPMLEVAQERQFVVSQQGGDSAEFEVEHTRRIEACLLDLDRHFHTNAGDQAFQAGNAPIIDHVGLWSIAEDGIEAATTAEFKLSVRQGSPVPTSIPSLARMNLDNARLSAEFSRPVDDITTTPVNEDDHDVVRAFLANQHHRSGRVSVGAARARKAIKLRRRDSLARCQEPKSSSSSASSHFCSPSYDRINSSLRINTLAYSPV